MANRNRAVGPVPQQGTIATPQMGHVRGPIPAATATQFGGGDEIPNTESTLTQVRGWPINRAKNILPASPGRESQKRTDPELQTQPAPPKVLRQLFARMFGNIGESGHGFPFDGGWSYLPHQFVMRLPTRTGPQLRAYDDNVSIPAVYAGNPRSR